MLHWLFHKVKWQIFRFQLNSAYILGRNFFRQKASHCPNNRKMHRSGMYLGRVAGFSSRQGFPALSLHFLQYNMLWCISGVASTFRTETRRKHCYHLLETGNRKFTKICTLQLFMFFIAQCSFYSIAWPFPWTHNLDFPKKSKFFAIPSRVCRGILDSLIFPMGICPRHCFTEP